MIKRRLFGAFFGLLIALGINLFTVPVIDMPEYAVWEAEAKIGMILFYAGIAPICSKIFEKNY